MILGQSRGNGALRLGAGCGRRLDEDAPSVQISLIWIPCSF